MSLVEDFLHPFNHMCPFPHASSPWHSSTYFHNRIQAAERLADSLSHYKGKKPLVLGIPRGSVPMAKVIAEKIQGELDVVLVHKIGSPDNPEFAIGSVSEFGSIYFSDSASEYRIPADALKKAAQAEIGKLKARRISYSPVRPPINPRGRIVIIVDDGIATGSTLLAAIRAVRSQKPSKLIAAAPVGSPRTLDLLRSEVDELIVLETPIDFFSISQFYDEFEQVTDDEVLKALAESRQEIAPHHRAVS